ncbi:hypothetical protein I2I05_08610 [Hymenobacter sp. BT683]|uniref:Uncharacterized protein n=1 Tax=Hymenobacter jeongseonensis TaxID=2791027 RepID=A0ABS0IHR0_9BACT|nr:hypothetical protein [Hymenobacter jeongseonensis]MBF9237458.1 hypothetical protein [Hymenobacter jeongseonensis]
MEPDPLNTTGLVVKHHPGSKGTDKMNTLSKDEQKQLRKEIIESCRSMMGRGWTYKMKMDGLAAEFGVSTRQAKKYITYTREDIQNRKTESYAKEYDEVLIKLETLYRDMYAAGKLDQALKVLNQLIQLRGYEAPKALVVKQEVQVRNDLSHLSADELRDLQRLLKLSNGHPNEGESDAVLV